ncbi:MAG: type secretion system protein VirB10 [Gammaproteobacteria bacterium]|nr:type secretion system protein VirB10 [Gammaproteobacteria bacterium]
MLAERIESGPDPRSAMTRDELEFATRRAAPEVGRHGRGSDKIVVVIGAIVAVSLGMLTLTSLSHSRENVAPAVVQSAPAPPPAPAVASTPTPAVAKITAPVAEADVSQSRALPMIIDNTGPVSSGSGDARKDAPTAGTAAPAGLSSDEMFAQRTGNEQPPTTHAVALSDPGQIIAQGTLIPAVLETALNSDLPGFARAIVSRDVHSFDGSRTLVPRGSRLIGQYKSGLATGQSRAFIIWTRVLRPDGVSVQLGSPVMDEKGEVGLSGDVNRHFWQRFGSSILLSVVAGATSAISDGSSTVVIGTSGAQSAASTALEADSKIPPTIRVPLGTPIQVFAARDLDFSGYAISHAPASP